MTLTARTLTTVICLVATSVIAQESLIQTFRQADEGGKRRILNQIAGHIVTPNINDMLVIVTGGLDDADVGVKTAALAAILSRAGGPRFVNDDATRVLWASEREPLQALRPSVLEALHAIDSRVRDGAVLALGNLDYAASGSMSLSTSTIAETAALYQREPESKIRSEIVKGLALSSSDSASLRQLLTLAFQDTEPSVRQYAAMGASRLRAPELLSQVIAQLEDPSVRVRLVTSGAVARYGGMAFPFLGSVMSAEAQESDATVKRALGDAVRAVEAGAKK